MKSHSITIREASIRGILEVHRHIPEFRGEVSSSFDEVRACKLVFSSRMAAHSHQVIGFKLE